MSPVCAGQWQKSNKVINDINYALLYNLLRQRDSKRTRSMLGAKKTPHTPLLHYDTDEMALLMSFRVRQRPGRKVKISACLLSSKMDMQFSPLQLAHRGAGGAIIDLLMSFCPRVVFTLTIHRGDVNFWRNPMVHNQSHAARFMHAFPCAQPWWCMRKTWKRQMAHTQTIV